MNVARKALAGIAGLGLLIAGCTAAAHIKAIQPKTPPPLPTVKAIAVPSTPLQLGIDIDAYTYRGQNIAAAASADISYVQSLHANAVAVSFPFFMAGPRADSVYTTAATPTPSALAIVVRDAVQAGLRVTLRPLLDEGSLGEVRSGWRPSQPAHWFASYLKFLLPYAAMAQREGASGFIVGTEFTKFSSSPEWARLDSSLRRVFRGTLAFANNFSKHPISYVGDGGPVQEGVDAYPPIHGSLGAGWNAYDRQLAPGTIEYEVGIAAAPGAFAYPWRHAWPIAQPDESVQARWFSAACHAAAATRLGGIYFWSIGFGGRMAGPSTANQGAWANSQGADAISRCFATLAKVRH